jgi:hypothetical protein
MIPHEMWKMSSDENAYRASLKAIHCMLSGMALPFFHRVLGI